jgi:23S rRNA (adenine2503-C2)-methyltransferase
MEKLRSHCLRDYSLEELQDLCLSFDSSPVRAKNLYTAINKEKNPPLLELEMVSRRLKEPLHKAGYYISPLYLSQSSVSSINKGTVKFLFITNDGLPVESVLMPAPNDRMTLCLSSQCGCAMGCKFCNTSKMGLIRNLSAGEILDQYHQANNYGIRYGSIPITNIVFMGMGEPFDNFDNVMTAFYTLTHPLGIKLARNRITISTSGHVEGLKKFAKRNIRTNIAVSLNATNNKTRDQLMPINRKWPLEDLLQTIREYPLRPGRVIVIEYVLIAGVNDFSDDATRLSALLKGISCKVNLIGYNESNQLPYKSPSRESILNFAQVLKNAGVGVLIRQSLGTDVDGACGQLGIKLIP